MSAKDLPEETLELRGTLRDMEARLDWGRDWRDAARRLDTTFFAAWASRRKPREGDKAAIERWKELHILEETIRREWEWLTRVLVDVRHGEVERAKLDVPVTFSPARRRA